MENEFGRIELSCDGDYVVPRNPPGSTSYPATIGPNQACTLSGAKPGFSTVSGRDYLHAGYNLDTHDIWRRDFVVLLGMFAFYQVMQLIAITYFQGGAGGGGFAVFAKETAETAKLNAALQELRDSKKDAGSSTYVLTSDFLQSASDVYFPQWIEDRVEEDRFPRRRSFYQEDLHLG